MVIKRHVFTKLIANYPELNYVPDDPEAKHCWLFFDCMLDPDTRRCLSEDYAFCRRWRDIGGKVHVDLHSDLGHHGQRGADGKSAATIEFPASAGAPVTVKFE